MVALAAALLVELFVYTGELSLLRFFTHLRGIAEIPQLLGDSRFGAAHVVALIVIFFTIVKDIVILSVITVGTTAAVMLVKEKIRVSDDRADGV